MVPNLGGHAKELRDLSHASLPVSGFDNKTETEKKKKKSIILPAFCDTSTHFKNKTVWRLFASTLAESAF